MGGGVITHHSVSLFFLNPQISILQIAFNAKSILSDVEIKVEIKKILEFCLITPLSIYSLVNNSHHRKVCCACGEYVSEENELIAVKNDFFL